MPRRPSPPLSIAPLQRIIAEPITDPAELAAIDRMRQRLKRKNRARPAVKNGHRARPVSRPASRKRA